MAGLNFQTQTIINANLDPDSSLVNGKGAEGAWLYKAGKEKVDGIEKDVLRIKRDFLFVKDNVKAIRKAEGYDIKDNGYVIMLLRLNFFGSKERKNFLKKICRNGVSFIKNELDFVIKKIGMDMLSLIKTVMLSMVRQIQLNTHILFLRKDFIQIIQNQL